MDKEVIIDIENPKDNDLISRQAVIDAIDKWVKNMGVLIALPANEVTPLFENIHELPSIKPQDCDTCEVGNPCLYCKHEFKAQADTIPREAVKDVFYDGGDNWWVKNMREQIKAQADGEYILKKDVMGCIGQTSLHWELARKLRKLPSVAIPSAEPYKGMTNGEVIKAMFGDDKVSEFMGYARIMARVGNWFNDGVVAEFDKDWWNSPYEPQERSEDK